MIALSHIKFREYGTIMELIDEIFNWWVLELFSRDSQVDASSNHVRLYLVFISTTESRFWLNDQ